MEMNFCRRCGSALTNVGHHVYKCETGHTIFANSSPTVGVFFVTPDNHVLLSERGIEPHKGMLDSFGGFVDGEESLEEAARRELKEELGIEPVDYEKLRYLCSGVGHYLYGGEVSTVLSSFYWTRLRTTKPLMPADDVAKVHSIPLNDVDFSLLHDDDARVGVKALQTLFLK